MTLFRLLLETGATVTTADIHGDTPLSLACSKRDLDIVLFLLEAGADVNSVDANGI